MNKNPHLFCHWRWRFSSLLFATALASVASPLSAQCQSPLVPVTSADWDVWVVRPWSPHAGSGLPANGFAVGGWFSTLGGSGPSLIAFYDPATGTCFPIGGALSGPSSTWPTVYALAEMPNGDLIAAGTFDVAGSVAALNIARWDGVSWSALGSGIGSSGGEVRALHVMPNGDLIAAGAFAVAGGVAVNSVARWDGSSWSSLGGGVLWAGGTTPGLVHAMVALPNGDLVVGGEFAQAGTTAAASIAAWNGTSWSAVGGLGGGSINALTVTRNGDLHAGGYGLVVGGSSVSSACYAANSLTWSTHGVGVSIQAVSPAAPGFINTMTALPDGSVLVGGFFDTAGSTPADSLARWDGTAWLPFGTGAGIVTSLASCAWLPSDPFDAMLATGGSNGFELQRFTTTCPASVATVYAGCAALGGSTATLSTLDQPWVNRLQRHQAVGVSPPGFMLSVMSFTSIAPVPLLSLFSPLGTGCDLVVNPDIITSLPITSGTTTYTFFLPNTPPIAGLTFYHQMLAFESDPTGTTLLHVSATSALALTAGTY